MEWRQCENFTRKWHLYDQKKLLFNIFIKKLFTKKEKGNFYSIYQSIEFFFFFTSNYIDTRTAKIIREIHTRLSENSFFYVIQFKILSKIHS